MVGQSKGTEGDGLESLSASSGKTHTLHLTLDVGPVPAATVGNDSIINFSSKPSMKRAQTKARVLRNVPLEQRITLEFSDVNVFVPILFTAPIPGTDSEKSKGSSKIASLLTSCLPKPGWSVSASKDSGPIKQRQVLFGAAGRVEPGEVLALMGPSGSGKSSLLTVLAGRSTATTTGSITFGGRPLDKGIKRKMGFVSQDDLLYAELTVYETLFYAAMLRLPRTWEKSAKVARVNLVLEGLGLVKCKDTIIGNNMMRGVSGGERKRVSIGHELLINPSIILLDEPTSGLDSTTALKLMHTLRTLASGGRTIITSIHQPSSRLYQQMDKLYLLSEGHTMFYGEASAAVHWFERMGQPLPFGVSIADHILDLACGDLPGMLPEESKEISAQLSESYRTRTVGLGKSGITAVDLGQQPVARLRSMGTMDSGSAARGLPASGSESQLNMLNSSVNEDSADDDKDDDTGDTKWGASWFDQLKYLSSRSARTRRFTSLSIQRIIEVISVSIIAGMFWWQLGGENDMDAQRAQDIGGLIFFMVLFMSFSSMFVSVFTFPLEFNMMVKERQSGMYRLSAYYFARMMSDIPMDCLLPSVFCFILYFMSGLRLDAGAFFGYWWGMLLTMFTAQSFGLLIGATVSNPKSGLTMCTIFMLVTMLIAGFYVRSVPVWISWMKYTSFIYWGWNLLLKIEFRNMTVNDPSQCPNLQPGETCDVAGTDTFEVDVDSSVAPDALILIGMLVFWRICIYYALKVKTTFRKR